MLSFNPYTNKQNSLSFGLSVPQFRRVVRAAGEQIGEQLSISTARTGGGYKAYVTTPNGERVIITTHRIYTPVDVWVSDNTKGILPAPTKKEARKRLALRVFPENHFRPVDKFTPWIGDAPGHHSVIARLGNKVAEVFLAGVLDKKSLKVLNNLSSST